MAINSGETGFHLSLERQPHNIQRNCVLRIFRKLFNETITPSHLLKGANKSMCASPTICVIAYLAVRVQHSVTVRYVMNFAACQA